MVAWTLGSFCTLGSLDFKGLDPLLHYGIRGHTKGLASSNSPGPSGQLFLALQASYMLVTGLCVVILTASLLWRAGHCNNRFPQMVGAMVTVAAADMTGQRARLALPSMREPSPATCNQKCIHLHTPMQPWLTKR
jgi:hypothetical protein